MDHRKQTDYYNTKIANISKFIEPKERSVQSTIETFGTSNNQKGRNDSLSMISITNCSMPTQSKERRRNEELYNNKYHTTQFCNHGANIAKVDV